MAYTPRKPEDRVTIWVTKYALSGGVYKVKAHLDPKDSYARVDKDDWLPGTMFSILLGKSDYTLTEEEAKAQVEKKIAAKRTSLEKSKKKLAAMKFVVKAVSMLAIIPFFAGCVYGPYPVQSTTTVRYGEQSTTLQGPVSDTKTIAAKLCVIQATRAGAEWDVTVMSRYPHAASPQYNIVDDSGASAKVLRFSPRESVTHAVVPVYGGLVTFAYANVGWGVSELRITVVDENNNVVHQEIFK